MGYVPDDARWFIADLVLETRVEGDARNVIHINTTLIRANSAERAYVRAMKLGTEAESVYANTSGRQVQVVFRGLQDLYAAQDSLKHGSELSYREEIGLSEEQVSGLVTDKAGLSAFTGVHAKVRAVPNYLPYSVGEMLKEIGMGEYIPED